jgi:hypothetical protein
MWWCSLATTACRSDVVKLVTFARDMHPHRAGDTRLIPDDLARKLLAEGEVTAAEDFPPRPSAAVSDRPAPAKRYVTKAKR